MTTLTANRPSPAITPLRTVIAAGGWTNGLLVLACVLIIALPRLGIGEEKAAGIASVLASTLVMFWALVGGSRLIAVSVQAAQLRLPRLVRQNLHHAAATLLLVVVTPALLLTMFGSHSLPFNMAVLATGLLAGLFWASIPPWLMFALMALGYVPYWLMQWFGQPWSLQLELPQILALAVFALLAVNICCWWHMAKRQLPPQGWRMPLALTFANGLAQSTPLTQQAQYSSALFTQDTPISHDLHRHPEQALGVALGPGFGRNTFKSVFGSQGPILATAVLWVLMLQTATFSPVFLMASPMLVLCVAMPPVVRLLALFRLPALGLHELALLPGLPRAPASAMATQLLRQMLLRTLPALLIMAGTGWLLNAPRAFHFLLPWTTLPSLLWLYAMALLALHSRPMRVVLSVLTAALAIATCTTLLAGMAEQPSTWLLPAWQAACVLGALFAGYAQTRLRALPHPWLQN